VAVDRERVQRLADEGSRRAASTLRALRTLSFQLSGAQLGITVSSLLLGFIVEGTIGELFRPPLTALGVPAGSSRGVALTLALVVATATQMVVGELIPKNLAIARPLGVAFAVVSPLRFSNALFKPIILFLNAAANWTVRLLGIEPREELIPVRSLEELGLLIETSRAGGALLEEEYTLLSRSISFGERTAADALLPRTSVVALEARDTIAHMEQQALKSGHSRFPVCGQDIDDIIGIAHIKNGYRFPVEQRGFVPVSEIAIPPMVVPESRDLESLLIDMRRDRHQLIVVADEYGGTAGIITIEDLLEEIVGEIEDEYDPSKVIASPPTMAGVHLVSGMLHPGEVEEVCGLEMPEGPYDSLAGFLLWLFDRIPRPGDHTGYRGWEFKVIEMNGYRIEKILVVAPGGSSAEGEQV
jgi:CBS domain containing-hemolysin-like protein